MNNYYYNLILDYVPMKVKDAIIEHNEEQQNNTSNND